MTEQYAPQGINPLNAAPLAIQTTSVVAVLTSLGGLTEDGSSLFVDVFGSGSNPAAPDVDNYVTSLRTTFTRVAGTIAIGASNTVIDFVGAAIVVAFAVDVPNSLALLSVTGPAFPYNHRFKVTTNLY